MAKYRLKTATSLALDPKKPLRTRLVRMGEEVELTDEQASAFREQGILVEDDEDVETAEATAPAPAPAPTGDPQPPAEGTAGDTEDGDGDGEPGHGSSRDDTELPTRPSNGASKDAWRSYLEQLKAVTDPEMDEPLEIPADATRDQMIAIGDQRVAEWNEE